MVALCLSVKAQQDTAKSDWSYSEKTNEMTSDHSYFAETSDNSKQVTATLTVRYSKKSNDVLISVTGGIFNLNSTGMFFKAKFDDSKIEKFSALGPDDGSFDTVFVYGTNRFLKQLKAAKITFIEIGIYNAGTYAFKFNTANLKWEH